MVELMDEEKKRIFFKRWWGQFRRRRHYERVQRQEKRQEEEERKSQEAHNEEIRQQHRAEQQLASLTQRDTTGEVRSRLRQSPDSERVTFNQQFAEPQGVTNAQVLGQLRSHNARSPEGTTTSHEELVKLRDAITGAVYNRTQYQSDQEMQANIAAFEQSNLLTELDEAILLTHQREQRARLEARMEDYKERHYLGTVRKPDGELAGTEDMVADRDIRDEMYNAIFAPVDAQPHMFFRDAFNPLTDASRYESFIKDIQLAANSRENIREETITKYIAKRAHENDPVPGETPEARKENAILAIQHDLREDLVRYQTERQVRETVHNANAVLELPSVKAEQIYDFIDNFSSELIDYTWRMPGVRDMMNIYEMQLRQSVAENDGYLKPEAIKRTTGSIVSENGKQHIKVITPEVEQRTKDLFKEFVSRNGLYVRNDRDGKQVVYAGPGRPEKPELAEWEVDRVFTMARGMMMLSMRMLSLASESKMPFKGEYTSLYLQDALQSYSPFTHLLTKYHVPSDKALSMLLTEPDREKIFGLVRKPWMTGKLEHVKHVLEEGDDGARKILDGRFGELLQIRRQNPGKCGDAFGYVSWRVGDDPEKISGSKEFLENGMRRMEQRVGGGAAGAANQYNAMNDEDRGEYLKEYGKWIGTGLRFERLRGEMDHHKHGDIEKGKELLGRIVELQPGRLYLKSTKIQERLRRQRNFSNEEMQHIQNNLLFLESKMYQMRENLLDEGYTFDGRIGRHFDLHTIKERLQGQGITLPHEDRWGLTQEFINLMAEDFHAYADHQGRWAETEHGKEFLTEEEGYFQEFIYNRDYNHGFTLWSGDSPVDEFHMAATGPTGGFIRRARENKDVGEANMLITGMLTDIKYMRTPDDAFKHLTQIYAKIQSYDAGMAKETITYLTEGLLKFFSATAPSKIPLIGYAVNYAGRGSMAQRCFGRRAPVWQASESRYMIQNLLLEHGYIKDYQAKDLYNHLTARSWDRFADVGGTLAPLIAVAILIYLLKEANEDE